MKLKISQVVFHHQYHWQKQPQSMVQMQLQILVDFEGVSSLSGW